MRRPASCHLKAAALAGFAWALMPCGARGQAGTDDEGFFTEYLTAVGYTNIGCTGGDAAMRSADYLCDGTVSEDDILPEEGLELGRPVPVAGDCPGGDPPALESFHPLALIDRVSRTLPIRRTPASGDRLDFSALTGGADNAMAYAWVYVENVTHAPLSLTLGVASDDSINVELNRREVFDLQACRGSGGAGAVQNRFPVVLRPGGNLLQFKVWNGCCGWNMRARFERTRDCPPDSRLSGGEPVLSGGGLINVLTDPIDVPDPPGRRAIDAAGRAPGEVTASISIEVDHRGDRYALEETFDAGWHADEVSPPAAESGEGFLRWEGVDSDRVRYRLRRTGYWGAARGVVHGTVERGGATTEVLGDARIAGDLPPGVRAVLVTASLAIGEDEGPGVGLHGCNLTPAAIADGWIVGTDGSGRDVTDETVVPAEGMEIFPDFGARSRSSGLSAIDNEDRFWTEPGDRRGGMFLRRATSIDGFYDFERDDIYGADVDDTMNVAFFYVVNERSEPVCVHIGYGSNDSGGVRVNGRPVHVVTGCPPAPGFGARFSAQLDPGKNLVSVYTFEERGGYSARIRFEDEYGNPIVMETTTDPSGYDPALHPEPDPGCRQVGPATGEEPVYVRRGPATGLVTEYLVPALPFDQLQSSGTVAGAFPEDYITDEHGLMVTADGAREGAVVRGGSTGRITTAVRGSTCDFTTLVRYRGFERNPDDPSDFDGEVFYPESDPDDYSSTLFFHVENRTGDELEAWFGFASDDAASLFVNGSLIAERLSGGSRGAADTVETFATRRAVLEPGDNLVQLSYTEGGGASGARVGLWPDACFADPFPEGLIAVNANPPGFTAPEEPAEDCSEVPAAAFVRGDSDSSGAVDLSDGMATLNWLFARGFEPPCLDAADADDSGDLNGTDAILVFRYLFLGGEPPAPPAPSEAVYDPADCGKDPTPDRDGSDLGCAAEARACSR